MRLMKVTPALAKRHYAEHKGKPFFDGLIEYITASPIVAALAANLVALRTAAEAEASKNNWAVVIAIIDSGGHVVMMHRYDNVQLSSIEISQGKAKTALMFKRPTKVLDDAISSGGSGLRFLSLKDIVPLEGGLPLVLDGKIVGAIGVSGVLSSQDAQIARAGLDGLK